MHYVERGTLDSFQMTLTNTPRANAADWHIGFAFAHIEEMQMVCIIRTSKRIRAIICHRLPHAKSAIPILQLQDQFFFSFLFLNK